MKLSLTQENLNKALAVVGRVVASRSSLPVLGNVLLASESNRLRLSATNLEIGINYRIGCKEDEAGSLTVPARLFNDLISSLPSGNIELSAEEYNLHIRTPHHQSTINGIAADEFPLIPEIKSKPSLTLPANIFREALLQVVIAASLDEARPVLAGVYMCTEDDNLLMAATDSYRLAEKKIKLKGLKEQKIEIIVPARTMQELGRILADAEGDLNIYLNENQVMFEVENIELTSRLIEGKFPNYRQIIPTTSESQVQLDTGEFNRVTKVASLFARENAGSIRLEVKTEGVIDVISNASQVGENTSSVEGLVKGSAGEISLNAKYLTDALGVIKSDEVSFTISGKLNPCVIKPISKDNDYLHIIMPLRT